MGIPITDPPPDPVLDQIGVKYNIFGEQGVPILVSRAANWALAISLLAMFLCVLLSAYQVMTASADRAGLESARKRLTNCLIGLSIIVMAWALILVVQAFFGFEIFG